MTNYRCRTHLDEPVTWRGTGCAQCTRPTRPVTPTTRSSTRYTRSLDQLAAELSELPPVGDPS